MMLNIFLLTFCPFKYVCVVCLGVYMCIHSIYTHMYEYMDVCTYIFLLDEMPFEIFCSF